MTVTVARAASWDCTVGAVVREEGVRLVLVINNGVTFAIDNRLRADVLPGDENSA